MKTFLLIKHVFRTYFRILSGALVAHGFFSKVFFYWLIAFPVYSLFVHITLFLDNIFYPGYKKVNLKSPVFIIANPRSGSTLLHRTITEDTDFVTFQYWELRFPALVTRGIGKKIVNFLIKRKKDVIFPKETGHETRLTSIEEEDVLFVLTLLDTIFLAFMSPLLFCKSKAAHDNYFNMLHDFEPHEAKAVEFFKNCLKRQAYYQGRDRVVAKMNGSVFRIQMLHKIFPDAKFIYLTRNPIESIVSFCSIHPKFYEHYVAKEEINDAWYKSRNIDKAAVTQEIYRILLLTHTHIPTSIKEGKIDKERGLEINYDDLVINFGETVERIKEFCQFEFSEKTIEKIKEKTEKQKGYKREHQNISLENIGLSEEQIKEDLAQLYQEEPALAAN